jgi:predicted permease
VSLARSQSKGGLRGVAPSATAGRSTLRLRGILIGSEMALSALLLILAGLLTSSLWHLQRVDKGFTAEQGVVVDLNIPETRYPDEARSRLFGRLVEGLRGLPGAREAAFVSKLPLSGEADVNPLLPDGAKDMALDPASHDLFLVNVRFISPEYLQAIGLPLKEGRGLAETDRGKAVALVSERLATKVWPGQSALGHRFRTFSGVGNVNVVGVVADVHATGLDQEVTPCVYVPYWHHAPTTGDLLLRTAGAPGGLLQAVRARLAATDPALSIPPLRTLSDVVADSIAPRRFEMQVVLGFAVAALLLACLGVYGVVAKTVAERRVEMGIRIALGSPGSAILRLVLGKGLRPVAIGLAAGILGALFAGRLVRSLLFGVSATDPLSLVAAALLLQAVAALACLFPALAAGRTDPVRVLRE